VTAEPRPIVHVGLPKTGTTTLQSHLFPHHPEVEYLGKFIGREPELYPPGVARLVRILRKGDEDAARSAPARELLAPLRQRARASGRVLVLSDEGMISSGPRHRQAVARSVSALLGPCRIMVVLRNPVELAESLYLQKMVWPQGPVPGAIGSVRWRSIDSWLDEQRQRPGGGVLSNLDYSSAIRDLEGLFGRESIGLFLLEQLRDDSKSYYEALLQFLGVDVAKGLELVARKRENVRLTQRQFDALRDRCKSPIDGLVLRHGPASLRAKIMASVREHDPNDDSGAARAPMSAGQAARIADDSREGNRRLSEAYGLPLERYGYGV
jgi:hypothetical protein